MTAHCVLDLETMGNRPTSAIVAIGAVLFKCKDNKVPSISSTFYRSVSLISCSNRKGFTLDADTIEWWLRQDKSAIDLILKNQRDIEDALNDFSEWLPPNCKIWGNSPSFDNAILSNAYKVVGKEPPWNYWNERDFRTIRALNKDIEADSFEGIKHYALDDAANEAVHLIKIATQKGISLDESIFAR